MGKICIIIRSHTSHGTYTSLTGLKLCCRCRRRSSSSRIQNLLISMMFSTQIGWVVPECSVQFGPNCSRFREISAILNRKSHILALVSKSILVISPKAGRNFARGIQLVMTHGASLTMPSGVVAKNAYYACLIT